MELEGEPAGNCGSGLSHVAADHPGITCGADRMLTNRSSARRHADEGVCHRSDLSQTEHEQTDAGTQNLPVSAAQDAGNTSRWHMVSSISPPWSIGSAAGFSAIECRSPWKPTSVSRPWKKLSPTMAGRRS